MKNATAMQMDGWEAVLERVRIPKETIPSRPEQGSFQIGEEESHLCLRALELLKSEPCGIYSNSHETAWHHYQTTYCENNNGIKVVVVRILDHRKRLVMVHTCCYSKIAPWLSREYQIRDIVGQPLDGAEDSYFVLSWPRMEQVNESVG